MNSFSVYMETMGCQMNVLDSELVLGQLLELGYTSTQDMKSADVVLVNTCSVREHAEDKAISRLGSLKKTKRARPQMVIGLIGCMAQRDPQGIIDKLPHVDLICGPGDLNLIPGLIAEVRSHRRRAVAVASQQSRKNDPALRSENPYDTLEELDLSRRPRGTNKTIQAYVRVQRGCDKFCTFCVVPFTRGPEQSRSPNSLLEEARMLADNGCKEITLLGQTVNSYAHFENGRRVVFSELLERMDAIDGIERLRFVTNYPGDFGKDVLEAMRDLPKVCEYLHIPAQSGSNEVLRRMKRQYTVEQYVELMHNAREIVPDVQLAGDFIVGFSGETEAEFQETADLVRHLRYKNLFVFKYSERPGTAADRNLPDDVPLADKRRRNSELLAIQEEISLANNKRMMGRSVEILVEGYSKAAIKAQEAEQSRGQEVGWRRGDQLVGQTRGDQIVVCNGPPSLIGRLIEVTVVGVTALTLHAAYGGEKPGGSDAAIQVLRSAS